MKPAMRLSVGAVLCLLAPATAWAQGTGDQRANRAEPRTESRRRRQDGHGRSSTSIQPLPRPADRPARPPSGQDHPSRKDPDSRQPRPVQRAQLEHGAERQPDVRNQLAAADADHAGTHAQAGLPDGFLTGVSPGAAGFSQRRPASDQRGNGASAVGEGSAGVRAVLRTIARSE